MIGPWLLEYLVYRAKVTNKKIIIKILVAHQTLLTSFVFKLGVDRDELEPDLEGGLSVFKSALDVAFRSPFIPTLSRPPSREL